MLDATIKSEILKEFLEIIDSVVEETKLMIKEDSLSAKAMDPAHIAMVDIRLSLSAFESYTSTPGEIGISVNKLREFVKLAKAGELVKIHYDDKKNVLQIVIGNLVREMSLIDPSSIAEAKMPTLNLLGAAVVRTEDIRQAIKGSESISEHITLVMDKSGFSMGSEGESADRVNLKIDVSELKSIKAPETIKSMFPLDYFSNMIKAISSAEYVSLYMSSDYPLKMEFTFADDKGTANYLLAPRTSS